MTHEGERGTSSFDIDVQTGRPARPWHGPGVARSLSCRAEPDPQFHRVVSGQPTGCADCPSTGSSCRFGPGWPAIAQH
jgi:hypothetical protein